MSQNRHVLIGREVLLPSVYGPYLKAFQYKVLNAILFTNAKLYMIGFIEDEKCSFCRHEPETLHHLLFHCLHSEQFWNNFETYFFSRTVYCVQLSMCDVLFGITTSKCTLLNYLLLVGKLYIWECRRKKILPNMYGFQTKVDIKYETEKFISTKNNNLKQFNRKW